MILSDKIALFALLFSALSIYLSYRGYLVAKKAQVSSEEWHKIDENRKQFIAQIVEAKQRSTDYWNDELRERIRATPRSKKGTYTPEEIANAELPPIDKIPDFDFELLHIELSLANLHHVEKRLEDIEIHIEFNKARWFNNRIQLSWIKNSLKVPRDSKFKFLSKWFMKYILGKESKKLLTLGLLPPNRSWTHEVNPFVSEYYEILPKVYIENTNTQLTDTSTKKSVSLKKPFIFKVGSKKYFWKLTLSMKNKLAKFMLEDLRAEPKTVKVLLHFDDGIQEISAEIRPHINYYSLPSFLYNQK